MKHNADGVYNEMTQKFKLVDSKNKNTNDENIITRRCIHKSSEKRV